MPPTPEDTIVALSSPPGASLRAVVRLSGPASFGLAAAVLDPAGPQSPPPPSRLRAGRAAFAAILALDGLRLPVQAWTFPAPKSYTREDLVEIHLPGSPPVIAACLEALQRAGARAAEPGEFTRRAFLNGRLDLAQAESVLALLTARSDEELRLAARRLEGGLSRAVAALADRVLGLRVAIEAEIDFADQDLPSADGARLRAGIVGAAADLERIRAGAARDEVFSGAPVVALVGAPNAGKSSLFNRLATGKRALVHAEPGTTRDVVEGAADAGGVRFRLQDTAGIGDGAGDLEARAMGLARRAAEDADLVLVVLDGAQPLDFVGRALVDGTGAPVAGARLVVENKCDLTPARSEPLGLRVSARTAAGLDELRAEIARRLGAGGDRATAPYLTNARQARCCARAAEALARAAAALDGPGAALDLAAADLLDAQDALGEILGRVTSDELLGEIFGRFCIGK